MPRMVRSFGKGRLIVLLVTKGENEKSQSFEISRLRSVKSSQTGNYRASGGALPASLQTARRALSKACREGAQPNNHSGVR